MRNGIKIICPAIFCVIVCITGCSSIKTVPYSFAEGESEQATLTFEKDVSFVAFNGEKLPEPQKGTRWDDTIIVPAGKPADTTVHVYYDGRDIHAWSGWIFGGNWSGTGDGALFLLPLFVFTLARDIICFPFIVVDMATAQSQATNRDVILSYSALENDKKYRIFFKRKRKKYLLFLKDISSGKVIYEQEFERINK